MSENAINSNKIADPVFVAILQATDFNWALTVKIHARVRDVLANKFATHTISDNPAVVEAMTRLWSELYPQGGQK